MSDTLQSLFRYKAWANGELLTALAGFGEEPPITKLAVQALSHTYIVDRIFAAHLEGRSHNYTSVNSAELPTLEQLSADIRNSDRAYVRYVSTLERDQLRDRIHFAFTDGTAGCMSREEMLMHVITHGVGHRGQISAVMLLNSAKPPKDRFTAFLHGGQGKN